MQPIMLYNSLTHALEPFVPQNPDQVGVYTCGPTVYSTASIGNFRAFLFADTLVRVLRYNGLPVRWVMNITDVGHLVGDADAGEDKMEVGARREGKTAWDIAQAYTDQFLLDMDRLNIERPDAMPKATDHIAEQIAMIERLEQNGHTYVTSDGVYFDVTTVKDYGRMAGQAVEEKEAGSSVEVNAEKRHPSDFALWKRSSPEEHRHMEWPSPWGVGFPGWHIECTAMSTKELGPLYDIHTGGVDHRMIHHPNEIAQAQGSLGTDEARVWMHNEFLLVDGGRMGKSLNNAYTMDDVVARGVDPLAYRYLILTAHYRRQQNFTFEALNAAAQALKKLRMIVRGYDTPAVGVQAMEARFASAINQDLDMPQAIAIVWELVNDTQVSTSAKAQSLLKFDRVLGLRLVDYIAKPIVVPNDVRLLVDERERARVAKDWQRSDALRADIKNRGYVVDDTPTGPVVIPEQDA